MLRVALLGGFGMVGSVRRVRRRRYLVLAFFAGDFGRFDSLFFFCFHVSDDEMYRRGIIVSMPIGDGCVEGFLTQGGGK